MTIPGLSESAIQQQAAVEAHGGYALIERVMDAVVAHRPDWVIQAARGYAKGIVRTPHLR
jgi:uncharacterized Zn finger protein